MSTKYLDISFIATYFLGEAADTVMTVEDFAATAVTTAVPETEDLATDQTLGTGNPPGETEDIVTDQAPETGTTK